MRRPHAYRVTEGRSARSATRIAITTAALLVVGSVVGSGIWQRASLPDAQALTPALEASAALPAVEADVLAEGVENVVADIANGVAAAGARVVPGDPPGWIRLSKPTVTPGPRRVGIQAGHWLTAAAPPELGRILTQTGTSWSGIAEWEVNLDIAERVAVILRGRGVLVDVLPTTIPQGYLADAFVALHADGDGEGIKSGFKLAHSGRRTPHEDLLQQLLTDEYGKATGLSYDAAGVSRNMTGYYGMSWNRVRYSTSPFTPSVVLEMGFLSHWQDRSLIVNEPDRLAGAIATGILRFLDARDRNALFGQDLVVPPTRFRIPSPTPST